MTEIIIVIMIIAVILSLLTGKIFFIAFAALTVLFLFLFSMALIFFYYLTKLLSAEMIQARFLRIETAENGKYKTAVYLHDGREYKCVFPAENIFFDKFYSKDKLYTVFVTKEDDGVFDKYAVITCVLGVLLCLALLYGFTALIRMIVPLFA